MLHLTLISTWTANVQVYASSDASEQNLQPKLGDTICSRGRHLISFPQRMENFILYEELGTGSSSVVYKGRRKGYLNYVAIICASKTKRPEITNHVRLSHDLDHPNIVCFYEWYETSNHLWLVVELCTGGSLESVIGHDGCLSEDVVRRFGWDLVKGLKHIHESGIILSDLTPAKILLDGSGVLKFGNFCLSKADGETLDDFFTLLCTSEEAGEEDSTDFDNIKERLLGSQTYSAPEVLQGSETNMSSDLWALGCILYYMYTGKPPFCSDSNTEVREMILHQEPPPPRQTVLSASPPSDDFQDLLKGLLSKNPDKRLDWPELLDHPFWAQLLKEEEGVEDGEEEEEEKNGCERVGSASSRHTRILNQFSSGQADEHPNNQSAITQPAHRISKTLISSQTTTGTTYKPSDRRTDGQQAVRHTTCGALRNRQDLDREVGKGSGGEEEAKTEDDSNQTRAQQMCQTQQLNKSFTLGSCVLPPPDNVSELRPKSGVDEDNTEAIFLLSSRANLRRSYTISGSPKQTSAPQASTGTDITSCLKALLHTESDLTVTPIMDNPKAVSTLTDLLRDNLRNSKIKQFLLPPLGEFLHLIASQEEKRGSPEGLWFVPAAAYTGLMRSLREGASFTLGKKWTRCYQHIHAINKLEEQYQSTVRDDSVVHHMAAKAIENISTTVSGPSHHLVTTEIGSALWYLFTHSTVEAVRVTAISSLSRLTRVAPAVFLAVIDTCGPAAILEAVSGSGARVQQHLLTAMATALLTSRIQTHRIAQSKDLVLKVLRCLESPSTVTRAKALLLLLLLIQDNTHMLLYCCQHRLVMYLERDLRKATPLRENPGQSGYLSQCLDLLIVYLSSAAPLILDDVLCALQGVIGRRHPSTAQSRQLKHTLPTMSVVLELLSSQAFRSQIVTEEFLTQIGLLLNYITSIESNETNLSSALGAAVCEELIKTSLSIVEVLSQHHSLTAPHHSAIVDTILPPLTTLAFSRNVEWAVFVLRVLSELSLVLLVHESDGPEEGEVTEEKKERRQEGGRPTERRDDGNCSQILALVTKSLLPRYESLLRAAEPIPLYALKLLVSMTEHSTEICRLIKHSRILSTVLQLIMANSSNVNSGMVQNAVALLCNLSGDTVLDLEPQDKQGLIEVVVSTISEAALAHLDGEGHAGRKVSHLVLQALLELLHNILKQTSAVVRLALQSQRLSCPAVEMEAAEKLLLENRPLSQLSTHLIHMNSDIARDDTSFLQIKPSKPVKPSASVTVKSSMASSQTNIYLSTENQEVWEESIQCLSLLVQLYGGEGYDCLSPSCLRSFSHTLRTHMHTETTRIQRTTLRIIKRLVSTPGNRKGGETENESNESRDQLEPLKWLRLAHSHWFSGRRRGAEVLGERAGDERSYEEREEERKGGEQAGRCRSEGGG
ncbi:hypothetical protein L3Q82_013026, partial [Scortum barcoo]